MDSQIGGFRTRWNWSISQVFAADMLRNYILTFVFGNILNSLEKLMPATVSVQKSYKSKSLPVFLQVQSSIEWRFANKNRRQQQLRRQPLPSLLLSCSSLNTRQTNEYIKVRLTQNSYLFYANTKRATSVLICIFPVALFLQFAHIAASKSHTTLSEREWKAICCHKHFKAANIYQV